VDNATRNQGKVVLDLIRKVLGSAKEADAADVAKAWIKQLESLISPVEDLEQGKTRRGISTDIIAYVSTGEPASVLGEIQKYPDVCQLLRLAGYTQVHRFGGHASGTPGDQMLALYQRFDDIPVALMLRWARLLVATYASAQGRRWQMVLPNDVHEPEVLLMHASGAISDNWSSQRHVTKGLTASGMERLLVELDLLPHALLRAAFMPADVTVWLQQRRALLVTDLVGYSDVVVRHADHLREALLLPTPQQRLHALAMLGATDEPALCCFVSELAELATSGSKQVRQSAELLLHRTGQNSFPPLRDIAIHGKPEQRVYALRQLWQAAITHGNEELRTFAREAAGADKASSVRSLIEEWDSAAVSAVADAERYHYDMPVIDWVVTITPAVDAMLDQMWREIDQSIQHTNQKSREHYEKMQAQGHANWKPHYLRSYSQDEIRALREYLASPDPAPIPPTPNNHRTNFGNAFPVLRGLAADPQVSPAFMFKALAYFGGLIDNSSALHGTAIGILTSMRKVQSGPDLLEVAERLDVLGFQGGVAVIRAYCYAWSGSQLKSWPDEAVWPCFAHHLDAVLQFLDPSQMKDYSFDRRALYRAIATLPEPPASVVNALYDIALGNAKQDRPLAQAALANLPDKEVRIIAALANGKAEIRAAAAQWLGKLRHVPAIPALEKAVIAEKLDVPKGALLDTLQFLGQPVEKYLDRKALAEQANKSLAKGEPKELAWFPWNGLPEVTWADSNEGVPPQVLRWMVVQAVKQKTPEPNAVLRKYCGMFTLRHKEALGQFILETWIAEDIRPVDSEQAMRNAAAHAQTMHAQAQSYPTLAQNYPQYQGTVEEITARLLPNFLNRPAGSAAGSKGMLAMAAACAGDRAAGPIARYLKEYYGTRAAQGKALISTLSWIESPAAIQLMLSIGNRFRTKSFQAEAEKQARALAERKGWTMEELADRTIPSAGFDETGTLELDFGPRCFNARLKSDFSVELFNPEGKPVKAMPQPRQDDDPELAKEARKTWSNVKKELKNIVTMQSERLYEALCTGRSWSFDDWQRYLAGHPVMRHLVQRLVWSAWKDERLVHTFRPLDDGTLTDRNDEPVTLDNDTVISIAHASHLPQEDVEGWPQHLIGYEITPLFQQFGKGSYTLPADKADKTAIEDFQGHLLETFALRGRATKLGYVRGPTEDGGWFMTYEKRYPTLGLIAVVEFTGNPLPETNRTVALLKLYFRSSQDQGWQHTGLPLSGIPRVLLSEAYGDIRLMAADGPGFDPEWEKKSAY
jgi:hypothetical protein